jgi:hypothetical protein
MKEVQRLAPVLVAALHHDFDGVTDAAIGFESSISQIIESAQDVVVPKRREREAQPAFVGDFASSQRAEHAALEQIVFSPLAGPRDGRRFAPCSFVFEQSFEHADVVWNEDRGLYRTSEVLVRDLSDGSTNQELDASTRCRLWGDRRNSAT